MPSISSRPRVWLEAPIIVVSILLAFGIEAGWAGLVEAHESRRLQELIRDDVVAMRTEVALRRTQGDQLIGDARALLAELADPSSEEQLVAALSRIGSIFVTGGWSPVNHTYVEAMSSGRLRLIEDESLRLALTRYQAVIDDIRNTYESIETQYYAELEPFLVANTIYSEIAADWWRDSLVPAPFKTDFTALARSRELWNLVTLRLEAELAVRSRLDQLEEMAEGLQLVLPESD
jgi:class 3 adenylate cyclase